MTVFLCSKKSNTIHILCHSIFQRASFIEALFYAFIYRNPSLLYINITILEEIIEYEKHICTSQSARLSVL